MYSAMYLSGRLGQLDHQRRCGGRTCLRGVLGQDLLELGDEAERLVVAALEDIAAEDEAGRAGTDGTSWRDLRPGPRPTGGETGWRAVRYLLPSLAAPWPHVRGRGHAVRWSGVTASDGGGGAVAGATAGAVGARELGPGSFGG